MPHRNEPAIERPPAAREASSESVAARTRESAYAVAYAAGCQLTVRFLLRQGASLDNAEELAQAAWAKGWECLEQLRNPDVLHCWVNSIALNMYRGACRRPKQVPFEDSASSSNLDLNLDIERALQQLRDADRECFEHRYIEGRGIREIAIQQHTSEGAVRIRLMRTRRRIRGLMSLLADAPEQLPEHQV